jgi:phosphoenolpyruvate carboxykinase (ATP)
MQWQQSACLPARAGAGRAREMVILGTQYAGEMKKGIFTVMHYFMPKRGILSLHSGCNVGAANDVSLFFGLSGARPPRVAPPPPDA